MAKLSNTEEQLMEIIWVHEKLFLKDLIDKLPAPKPAATTVATLLKRMQEKGFVGYTLFGNSREYHALIKKEDYFSKQFKDMIKNFFGDSTLQFASFFTKSSDMSASELEDLKQMIEEEIKRKKA